MSSLSHQSIVKGKKAPISSWHHYLSLLRKVVRSSEKTFSSPLGGFTQGKSSYYLPRLVHVGQNAGNDPIRLGLLAGFHGDALAGPRALLELIRILESEPLLGKGYELYFYPVINPTGIEAGTALSRSGKDLRKEFGKGSDEPEIYYLEQELVTKSFHGLIHLMGQPNTDRFTIAMTSTNLEPVVQAALKAASYFLEAQDISKNTILTKISKPKSLSRSGPFELTLTFPQEESVLIQVISTVFALKTILERYREVMAVQTNL